MFLQWITGGFGKSTYNTFNSDEIAESFKNAKGVEAALNYFYNKYKNSTTLKNAKVEDYGVSFGLKGLFQAGFDPIEQFVGSYNVNIYFRSYSMGSGGYLEIVITNTTSMTSFAYHLLPSYDTGGPGSNAHQRYQFSVNVDYSKLNKIKS
ncbi:hypothetical protein ASG38_17230 [Flavobacterium sp. Leaf359]|uniref:hypothetical protein n=1 Tax=Flavobacterium sp. Leaf359 TaxID=1736351 RepID=UPI0006FBB96D|nr:hypothetical protein [Flavobacterium sp. Leaf359]KQS52578.1 hypothetical protein ASG38_17230 [Flavobacterium sp. Leaf359]